MFSWRKYEPKDFDVISPWYVAHGWEAPPDSSILPSTGIVVELDGEPIGAGFLYLTNSPMALLEWLVTKPCLGRQGLRVLEYLLEVIKVAATGLGVTKMIHLSKPKYARVFEKRLGFRATEEATILVWQHSQH